MPDHEHFKNGLKQTPSSEHLLPSKDELVHYECDGLTVLRETPMAVAIPDTPEEVQAILAAAREHEVPGVCNLAISESVSDLNLYYTPDSSSQITCAINGCRAAHQAGTGSRAHSQPRVPV